MCPVRIQVAERKGLNKIETIDVLKSLNTKVGKLPAPDKSDLEDAAERRVVLGNLPEVSIADLIEIAQPLHPEIFSRSVTDALGVNYQGNSISAKFTVAPVYTGSAADYDLTEIGKPTLTASSTLVNANLVPGVNAPTGAPGSAHTGESADPTRDSIAQDSAAGQWAKFAA